MTILESIPSQYAWIIVGIIIMAMELVIPGFILFFFGLGAVLVGITSIFIDIGLNVQLTIFTIVSLISLFIFRKYSHGYFKGNVSKTDLTSSKMDSISGERAVVVEDIIPNSPKGKVEFHGSYWNADSDEEIKKGTKVIIIERHDLTLKVKK